MQSSRASRLLGHYEYEILYPGFKAGPGRKRSHVMQTNLNTTIEEILDEVCNLQGLNPKDYEILYEGKKLERSLNIRKSGLPIHGVLDLVASANVDNATMVNVGLQLENGKRLAHKFNVEETLWNVLRHWEAQGEKILREEEDKVLVPVCNYLRQTIVGKDDLEKASLRSVGLTRGSGVIRLNLRAENDVGNQANVSSQVSYPPSNNSNAPSAEAAKEPVKVVPTPKATSVVGRSLSSERKEDPPVAITTHAVKDPLPVADPPPSSPKVRNTKEESKVEKAEAPNTDAKMEVDEPEEPSAPLRYAEKGQYFILGENTAVAYHGDDVRSPKLVAESDDFFEITVRDVESIYRELRAKRAQLEEAPLITNTKRSEEKELQDMHIVAEHPSTVVRIRFPDRFVLQGVFATTDYISSIYSFVRRYLEHPDLPFYLFTAPPKTELVASNTLLQQNLHGLAIVYFGCETKQEKYFQAPIYNQLSDPDQVFKNSRIHSKSTSGPASAVPINGLPSRPAPPVVPAAALSQNGTQAVPNNPLPSNPTTRTTPNSSGGNSGVVPKWFKTAK